jgi:quercetin dioxygenase-like cupin family protein
MATTKAKFVEGGAGTPLEVLGTQMAVLVSAADTGGGYEVVRVHATGEPGAEIMPHRHPWEECYLVVDGVLEVQVGARRHLAGPGAFVTIPPRALHGFRVVGDAADFVHFSLGRGATDAFRDYDREVPHAPTLADLDAVLAINARHGIEVVLPPLEELEQLVG